MTNSYSLITLELHRWFLILPAFEITVAGPTNRLKRLRFCLKWFLNRIEVGRTYFGLGGGAALVLSLQSPPLPLSRRRPSRTCERCVRVGLPATGSGLMRPAGSVVADRRPSYPFHFRVERAAWRGATGLGAEARCPAAAGAVPGQVCAAGPSRSGITDRPVGGIKFLSADSARNTSWIYVPRNLMSVGLILAPIWRRFSWAYIAALPL